MKVLSNTFAYVSESGLGNVVEVIEFTSSRNRTVESRTRDATQEHHIGHLEKTMSTNVSNLASDDSHRNDTDDVRVETNICSTAAEMSRQNLVAIPVQRRRSET